MKEKLLYALALIWLCAAAVSWSEGLPRRGALGVSFEPVSDALRQRDKLAPGEGALVSATVPGLTGDKAGLKPGDVVIQLDGSPVTVAAIAERVRAIPVGQTVHLKVLRDGSSSDLSAVMVEKPRYQGNDKFEVIYSDVTSNGHLMRTIITRPKAAGKHPGFMFIQGYSPISYDYDLSGKGLDAPILFDFANSGFVTMRVEKPGVGDSEGGPFAQIDYITELDIYRQALKQLKALTYVDDANIFLFGHSMGGAFGPMVACEIPVKGIAVYGIAARTWHEYFLDTLRYQNLLGGASYSQVDDLVRQASRAMEMVFQGDKTPEQVAKEHPDLKEIVDKTFPGGLFSDKAASFWKQLENTNFASYWEKCNTHVLAVWGESDFVSYRVDHQLVADIVNAAHPGWGKFAIAPHSDHLFSNWPSQEESLKHWPTGDFNPAFLNLLKGWVQDVMQGRA